MKIEITETLPPGRWIGIQIQPCRDLEDGMADPCTPEQADYYGVYLRMEDGQAIWFADCETEAEAITLENLIREINEKAI